jgi:hypothetical protein
MAKKPKPQTIHDFDLDSLLSESSRSIAEFLGVTVPTVERWKANRNRALGCPPLMAVRLLAMRYQGDMSALLGKDWEGFTLGRDGLLYMPNWRRGWTPHELSGSFYTIRLSNWYKRQHEHAARDLAAVRNRSEERRVGKECRRLCRSRWSPYH